MCIFAFGLFDKLKNEKFSSFSYFAKKVSGHDTCCVPFSESACKTENNDTKYDIEFRILSIRKMPWTTQSLNLASDVEAWCTVRPYGSTNTRWHRQTSAPPVDSSWTAEHVETSEESRIYEAWLNYFASFISKMMKCTGYTTPILFKQYNTRREFVRQIRKQWLFTNLRTPCGSHKLC